MCYLMNSKIEGQKLGQKNKLFYDNINVANSPHNEIPGFYNLHGFQLRRRRCSYEVSELYQNYTFLMLFTRRANKLLWENLNPREYQTHQNYGELTPSYGTYSIMNEFEKTWNIDPIFFCYGNSSIMTKCGFQVEKYPGAPSARIELTTQTSALFPLLRRRCDYCALLLVSNCSCTYDEWAVSVTLNSWKNYPIPGNTTGNLPGSGPVDIWQRRHPPLN